MTTPDTTYFLSEPHNFNNMVKMNMFKLFTEPKDKPKRNSSVEEITNRLEKR